jgi:type I restriction enzyme S subunit
LSVTKNGILPQLESAAKTNDGDNRRLVLKGDFVINSRSDRKGSSGIAKQDGSVSLINIVLQPINMSPVYCNYLMKNYTFIEEFYRIGHGIVADLWTTRYVDMKSIVVGIPPFPEQAAIANFLDQKTAEIDQAIALKADLIERLKEYKQITIQYAVTRGLDPNAKMKASGVEWIGDIPEGWEIRRFKFLASVRYGLGQPPREKADGLKIIRATNVERGKIVEKNMLFVDPNDIPWERNPELKEGEIIVVRSGAYTGDSALVTGKYAGCIAGYDMVATPKNCHATFLAKALLCPYVLFNQIYLVRLRSAQPHLNAEELNELLIIVPPLAEQTAIVAHIEAISAKIDQATDQAQQQINTLTEYKTVLINAAVTGKIKVTDDSAQGIRHAQ